MEEQEESQSNPKNPTKKTITVVLIIIGVVVIAWFVWVAFSSEEADTNSNGSKNSAGESSLTNSADQLEDSGTDANKDNAKKDDPEAQARDEQRIVQIKEIQAALTSFFDGKGNYPERMQELVSEGYLSELPQNPTPGGINYVYTPIGSLPAKYYDLAYSLEAGTDEVDAGDHIANPDGIAYP